MPGDSLFEAFGNGRSAEVKALAKAILVEITRQVIISDGLMFSICPNTEKSYGIDLLPRE